MEDIESMGVKQLKDFITARGGDFSDCVEKSDLKKRALQLAAVAPKSASPSKSPTAPVVSNGSSMKTAAPKANGSSPFKSNNGQTAQSSSNANKQDDDFVDENAEISDSDDEEEDGNAKTKDGKPQKRFSVFRVKKFVTSKIGSTSAGRATVMRVLGEDGDVVVRALKSVTAKIRDEKTAKENKKDAIRFCLKAYNLWKHKDFDFDNTKPMQHDAQLLAEIFIRESMNAASGRKADVAPMVRISSKLHDACLQLMSPHVQPKNASRLSELLKFYFSAEFFEALLNVKENNEEREAMDKSISTLLMPLPPIMAGERERSSLARNQTLMRVLENKRFEAVLDHPQVAQMFQQYLDLELGLASKNGLRFLLAVRDFEKTASRDLQRMRAPKIVERFLSSNSELKIEEVDSIAVKNVLDNIESGSVGMGMFSEIANQVKKNLEDDFASQFVGSKDYMDLLNKTAQEVARLEKQLAEEGSLTTTPGGLRFRKSVA